MCNTLLHMCSVMAYSAFRIEHTAVSRYISGAMAVYRTYITVLA